MSDRVVRFAIVILVCSLATESLADEGHLFEIGGGSAFSSTVNGRVYDRPISHGHAYFVAGEPGFVFSGTQSPCETWKLNYLVLIRHNGDADSTFRHRRYNPDDPEESSDGSDAKIRYANLHDEIRFDNARVHFVYKAQVARATSALISEEIFFQGLPYDLTHGRVFAVDMSTPAVSVVQVDVPLPSIAELDLMQLKPSEYKALTNRWLSEVATCSEVVRNLFGK